MMKMKTLLAALTMAVTVSSAAFAQAAPADIKSNPTIELTFGFDGPVHQAAQFPGLSLSGAFLIPRGDQLGFGVVVEADAAYLRPSQAAGVRIYKRSGSLGAGKQSTVFVQILAGTTTSDDEGIFHSTSSTLVQPGVGLSYGGLRGAWHIQADYHHLSNRVVTKTGKAGEPVTTETLPNYRFLIGFTWRLRAR